MKRTGYFCFVFLLLGIRSISAADETALNPQLTVPAFTAYIEPQPDAVQVSVVKGITGWTSSKDHIVWYGYFAKTGNLNVSLTMRQPEAGSETLRLRVGNQERTVQVKGGSDGSIEVDFGTLTVAAAPGYNRFMLEGVRKDGTSFGDLISLQLRGPAAQHARFNLAERRNAASVHLGFPIPPDAKVAAFYNEVTVLMDPIWSYFMACGFQRGYFGIQVNSPTERRIIFSVWDSGAEAVNRNKVAQDDRVQLLAKGEGVTAGDFGNEGTGGHSHLIYPWKRGTRYRFLLIAKADGSHTTYSGYFYFPEKKAWGLIASFLAPKDGNTLKGLYSFNENFVGANGQLRRAAEFRNQWIRTTDRKWIELTSARFTHDPTGRENRKDYGAGAIQGGFYLVNGGFEDEPIRYGDILRRSEVGKPPADIPEAILP